MLLPLACSSVDVKSQVDPQTNLKTYRTYAWAPVRSDTTPGPGKNSILDKNIRGNLDLQFQKIGLTQVSPNENPDFLVVYYASIQNRLTSNGGMSMGMGFGGPGWVGYSAPTVTEYQQGTLIVDFVHPGNHENFWRGSASGTVDDSSHNRENIQVAAQKLAAQFNKDRTKEQQG